MDQPIRYPVAGEELLSPRFYSSYASEHRGVVAADGSVTVLGCKFILPMHSRRPISRSRSTRSAATQSS